MLVILMGGMFDDFVFGSCGIRSRSTVMQLSNVTGRKLIAFTREEFEGLLKISDDIRREIVLLEKRS